MRDAWWDLVHGSSCCACGHPGRILCPGCAKALPDAALPVRPEPAPEGLAACFAAGPYADPLRALILRHKEQGAHALAEPLGRVLGGVVGELLDAAGPGVGVVLVPVPSAPASVRARGHDPLLRITRVAAARVRRTRPARIAQLLRLWRPVADQAGLDRAARASNLRETMALRPHARRRLGSAGARDLVVVCDDVLTTGSTAREAQRALEDSGMRCDAVATIAATVRRLRPADRSDTAGIPEDFAGSLP